MAVFIPDYLVLSLIQPEDLPQTEPTWQFPQAYPYQVNGRRVGFSRHSLIYLSRHW